MIELDNVAYVYPTGTRAVDGVSLTIGDGERVAIIGQNGSGKSTLVRQLNGLLRPTEGRVLLDGIDAASQRVAQLAAVVGLVFQDPDRQIFAGSVRAEVEFGPRNAGLAGEALRVAVDEALSATGLTDDAATKPYDLGYSRRKLLALASVLAMKTPVVVLDEPTTGQDARGVRRIEGILDELAGAGRTVIAISHDMRFVADCFERVIVMRDGQVILDGTPRHSLRGGQLGIARVDVSRTTAAGSGGREPRPGIDSHRCASHRAARRPVALKRPSSGTGRPDAGFGPFDTWTLLERGGTMVSVPKEASTMRILLAIDGSRSADVARDLVAAMPWPAGSAIRIVSVVPGNASLGIDLSPDAANWAGGRSLSGPERARPCHRPRRSRARTQHGPPRCPRRTFPAARPGCQSDPPGGARLRRRHHRRRAPRPRHDRDHAARIGLGRGRRSRTVRGARRAFSGTRKDRVRRRRLAERKGRRERPRRPAAAADDTDLGPDGRR